MVYYIVRSSLGSITVILFSLVATCSCLLHLTERENSKTFTNDFKYFISYQLSFLAPFVKFMLHLEVPQQYLSKELNLAQVLLRLTLQSEVV